MSKREKSHLSNEARKIITEVIGSLHLQIDSVQRMRLENYLTSKLLSVYYEGYSQGLQKAREIVFPIVFD